VPPFAPSPYRDDELFTVVRDVCRYVRPKLPLAVTQKEFDGARGGWAFTRRGIRTAQPPLAAPLY